MPNLCLKVLVLAFKVFDYILDLAEIRTYYLPYNAEFDKTGYTIQRYDFFICIST